MTSWRSIPTMLCALSMICATAPLAAEFDCRNDEYVDVCQKMRGRLSQYANSHIVLWPVGTKRLLGLDDRELQSQHPKLYDRMLDGYTVFADFEVCRNSHDIPGHMMSACIADMSNATYFTREEAKRLRLYGK